MYFDNVITIFTEVTKVVSTMFAVIPVNIILLKLSF